MKTVGVRDLKNRLSEYLRMVRSGESVLITDRGEVIAELNAPGRGGIDPGVPPGLQSLARRGLVRLGGPNDKTAYRRLTRVLQKSSSRVLLDQERGEKSNLYAESSAVLSWLLGESDGIRVLDCLVAADTVVASELTLVECDRVLIRAVAMKTMSETAAADRRAELYAASALWHVFGVGHEVLDRARQSFPEEPVRTSDALHLATAVLARSAVPGIQLLSVDERVRASARRLGFRLLPEPSA